MSHDFTLTEEEVELLSELKKNITMLSGINVNDIFVTRRHPEEWYLELSFSRNVVPIDHHAYDIDIYAEDENGAPLGIAIFFSDNNPLSKIHVFRYDGSGAIRVRPGSVKIF